MMVSADRSLALLEMVLFGVHSKEISAGCRLLNSLVFYFSKFDSFTFYIEVSDLF